MKVLQINSTLSTGSTGRITDEIGNIFIDEGFGSYVAYNTIGPGGSRSKKIKIGNTLDTAFHGLKTRLLDLHGFGSKRATNGFIKELHKINPDIIGLHNLHGYYLNIEVLFNYLKQVQKPIVWTFHDCWPFTGHCSFFDYVSCDKWETECHTCPLSDKYPASWHIDNSRKNFYRKKELFNGLENLTIVTPSHWLKDLVAKSFLSGYPVQVIHNGIDLGQFKPTNPERVISKYNLGDKKVLLGVASVWDRRKGLDYFFELGKVLDDNYRIVLIGLPEGKLKGLPENIVGIPRTENIDELVSFYSAADVFINPTLVDNFPTTNLEALGCGTPVITFETGGSPEAIDKKTGLVVKKGDVKGLLSAIDEITANDKQFYQKGCRDRAIKFFNKDDRYRDYLGLYLRALERDYLNSECHTEKDVE